jgi:hypothetical protein
VSGTCCHSEVSVVKRCRFPTVKNCCLLHRIKTHLTEYNDRGKLFIKEKTVPIYECRCDERLKKNPRGLQVLLTIRGKVRTKENTCRWVSA